MNGVVLDAGGLIAADRNSRHVYALIKTIHADGGRMIVPATALARVLRNPARQAGLARILLAARTEVIALDSRRARAVGALLAKTGTSDIADAHVVVCAQDAGLAVITSDPFDLRRLDPGLRLIAI